MNKTIQTKVSTVTCIQASRCARTGKEIFTLELEYPRQIHSQLLTHGVFSKNSSSTRAVPLKAAIEQLRAKPAGVIWTANQSGMQGNVLPDNETTMPNRVMAMACNSMVDFAEFLNDAPDLGGLGIHKQNAGRLLEPFQNIKIVLTSTEWENWDWLRIHKDAQGEIADLALAMKEARDAAEIMELEPGELHVPYVERIRKTSDDPNYSNISAGLIYLVRDEEGYPQLLSIDQAKQVSASVCAQVSYRKADNSLDRANRIQGMLVNGHKVHASPFEHQAEPMPEIGVSGNFIDIMTSLPDGVTHVCKDGQFGSGNLKGWVQNRQIIDRHDKALF